MKNAAAAGQITTVDAGTEEAIAALSVQKISSQFKDSLNAIGKHYGLEFEENENHMQKASQIKKTILAKLNPDG